MGSLSVSLLRKTTVIPASSPLSPIPNSEAKNNLIVSIWLGSPQRSWAGLSPPVHDSVLSIFFNLRKLALVL